MLEILCRLTLSINIRYLTGLFEIWEENKIRKKKFFLAKFIWEQANVHWAPTTSTHRDFANKEGVLLSVADHFTWYTSCFFQKRGRVLWRVKRIIAVWYRTSCELSSRRSPTRLTWAMRKFFFKIKKVFIIRTECAIDSRLIPGDQPNPAWETLKIWLIAEWYVTLVAMCLCFIWVCCFEKSHSPGQCALLLQSLKEVRCIIFSFQYTLPSVMGLCPGKNKR